MRRWSSMSTPSHKNPSTNLQRQALPRTHHLWLETFNLPRYPPRELGGCSTTEVQKDPLLHNKLLKPSSTGLAASLGYGAASEVLRRKGAGSQDDSSVMMTEANIKRLVSKLSQMRGAALKLGQFMSIQGEPSPPFARRGIGSCAITDTHILPPEIDKIFRRVQDSAHYMPDWQMEVRIPSIMCSGQIPDGQIASHADGPRPVLGGELCLLRPDPIRRCVHRAGAHRGPGRGGVADGAGGARGCEDPVPQYRELD